MKIAFVAPLVTPIAEPQLGGSQALLADIAAGLTARGHEVLVFAASGSAVDGARVVDTGINSEMLSATFFRANEESSGYDIARDAFAHVYGLVGAYAVDLVHNHAFDVPAVELANADVPVVHTLHLPPTEAMTNALAGSRAVVACVSESHARAWRTVTKVDVVLPNGVPVDRISWSEAVEDGLLYAGRFSPEKGVLEAIEIARRSGVPLTVVGSAYDEEYAQMVRGAEDVDVRSAVVRTELWRMMAASRGVLCPIQWDEPFGLVAAEAQAAGTPVVAFARGALPEVVIDGQTGFVVETIDEAVAAVARLGDIERSMCRKHAEADLSLERSLDAHEALYEKLVS